MNCAEFQKVLPYIIETGGNVSEEEHLRDCSICSDLVRDLKYIADQAKLLVPMEDPSPRVWDGIRGSLEREHFIRPARSARRGLLRRRSALPWVLTLGALALAFALFAWNRNPGATDVQAVTAEATQSRTLATGSARLSNAPETATSEEDDLVLLSAIAAAAPSVRAVYEKTLRQVNHAIAEASDVLRLDPGNREARRFLTSAYEQKAMLYSMAVQSLN